MGAGHQTGGRANRLTGATALPATFFFDLTGVGFFRFRFARRELESHFTVLAAREKRRKWAAFLGNEAVQQIGLAGGEQLLHLLGFDRALRSLQAALCTYRIALGPRAVRSNLDD